MDKHNVRLTLRRHIDIESRLIAHLLSLKPRRHHVKVRVGELLALGLEHKPPGADVDDHADPAAQAMELYVPLARPADAPVLDALAARPEQHRNDWLRARLLAGFAASENISNLSNTAKPTAAPTASPAISFAMNTSSPRAASPPVLPTAKRAPTSEAAPVAASSSVDIEIDVPIDIEEAAAPSANLDFDSDEYLLSLDERAVEGLPPRRKIMAKFLHKQRRWQQTHDQLETSNLWGERTGDPREPRHPTREVWMRMKPERPDLGGLNELQLEMRAGLGS
jgi:hypothetical protein